MGTLRTYSGEIIKPEVVFVKDTYKNQEFLKNFTL